MCLGQTQQEQIWHLWPNSVPKMITCITTENQHRNSNKMVGPMKAKFTGIADRVNGDFRGQFLPRDTAQQINTANGKQLKGEIIEQSITAFHLMLTPQTQELMDSNDRPCCPMQIFQQRNINNPNMYTECRFTILDHPPQRTIW